jgi:hypothetical protein
MKFMEYLDFFPTPSTFTINQHVSYKTSIGGCLTLLSIIICISFSIDFIQDFIEKRNPRIYSENIYEKIQKPYDLNKEDLVIAWRLEDKDGNVLGNNDIKTLPFYPKSKFHKYKMIDGEFIKNQYITLNSTKCSDYFKEKNIGLDLRNKEKWNCLDTSNITMGGYWNSEFLDYFDFSLATCQEVEEDVFKNCVDYEKIKQFYKNEVYISFMFGKVFNENQNFEKPLILEFYNFFRKLDLKLPIYDKCNFSYVKIKDDIGAISSFFKEGRKMTFKSCNPNYSINDDSIYEERKNNANLYFIEFYLDNNHFQNHRIFSKISNVLSQIGGMFNIIFLIISWIYSPINLLKRNYFLMDYFFKYQEEGETQECKKKIENFKEYTKKFKKKSSKINKKKIKESDLYCNHNSQINKYDKLEINKIDLENEAIKKQIPNKNYSIEIKKENENNNDIEKEDLNLNKEKEFYNTIIYTSCKKNYSKISQKKQQIDQEIPEKYFSIEEKNLPIVDKIKNTYNSISIFNPDSENNLENPDSENNLENPDSEKNLENPDSEKNLENPDSEKNLEYQDIVNLKINKSHTYYFEGVKKILKVSFLKINFILYYIKCCRRKSKKNLYHALENGIFKINKKMELRRYLKNLQLLRIIGKITLLDEEKFYFKNYYRNLLDNKEVLYSKENINQKAKVKFQRMVKYIKKNSKKDFNDTTQGEKMIFINILNQGIDEYINLHED